MTTPGLLIVDDDEVVRQMLPTYFAGEQFRVVGVVASAHEALAALTSQGVDIVLTDMRMPGMDGIELVREIRRRTQHIPIVGITSFEEDEYVIELLRAGAAGIVLKSAPRDVIVRALETALEGKTYVDPDMAGRLQHYLKPVETGGSGPALTTREREVLDLLLQGMPNSGIADELSVTVAAVKKHVGALFNKYDVDSRLKLVIAALRQR